MAKNETKVNTRSDTELPPGQVSIEDAEGNPIDDRVRHADIEKVVGQIDELRLAIGSLKGEEEELRDKKLKELMHKYGLEAYKCKDSRFEVVLDSEATEICRVLGLRGRPRKEQE